MHFDTWDDFVTSAPFGARLVAIEMGGEALDSYNHPPNAVYV